MASEAKGPNEDRPLSPQDVQRERQALLLIPEKEMLELLQTYYQAMMKIVTQAEKVIVEEDEVVEIESLKRIIGFFQTDELFIRTKAKVWKVRGHIMKQNMKFFVDRDYSHLIKKNGQQAFIEHLISIVKNGLGEMTPQQIQFYWDQGKVMLNCIARYRKVLDGLKGGK